MTEVVEPWVLTHGEPGDPLLLCLHGIGSCASAFEPQAPLAAAKGRHLMAWDAPGYRNSPDPKPPWTLDDWADAAAELIRAHGSRSGGTAQADVLGVSWGGVTATRLVLRHPDLVRSLILADSSIGSGTSPENTAAMRSRAADLDAIGIEEFARSRAPRLLTPDAPAPLVDAAAQMMIDSVRLPSYLWACESMGEANHRAQLGEITTPTLVIVGEQDVVTPPERSEELAAGIPGATLVTVPGAGHLANQQQPQLFNTAVGAFLDEHSPVN